MRVPTKTAQAVIIWTGCGTSTSVHMRQFAKHQILAVIFHVHGHGQVSFDLINPVPKCGIVSHGGFVRRVVLDSAWRPGKPHSRYCPMSTVLRSYQRFSRPDPQAGPSSSSRTQSVNVCLAWSIQQNLTSWSLQALLIYLR